MDDHFKPALSRKTKAIHETVVLLLDAVRYITIILLIFAFTGGVYTVEQTSMTDTLLPDERLLVSDLFYTPARNDIIVFKGVQDKTYIKRIIGLPGDELQFNEAEGIVYLKKNGETDFSPLHESFIKDPLMEKWGDIPSPVTVPDGHYFVMGDNRNGSTDSRTGSFGTVDRRCILGHVLLRFAPIAKLTFFG